jgi:hypothetical protein
MKTSEENKSGRNQPSKSAVGYGGPEHEVCVEIEGIAPLIQNRFSQKALEQMLRKQVGLSTEREAKKPREVLEAAKILNTAGAICLPPTAVKNAMITAAITQIKEFAKSKKQLRTQLFIDGGSIPITYEREEPRMDIVRLAGASRTPDIRFRPSFHGWKAQFIVVFPEQLKVQTVLDLIERGGKVGLGEWRPEKGGDFGTFVLGRVLEDAKDRERVRKGCRPPVESLTIPDWAMDAEIDPALARKIMAANNNDPADGNDEDEEAPPVRAVGGRKGR